jgi:K+-transporting ATPase KdpF subunit
MGWLQILSAVLAAALFVYLVYALIRAESL